MAFRRPMKIHFDGLWKSMSRGSALLRTMSRGRWRVFLEVSLAPFSADCGESISKVAGPPLAPSPLHPLRCVLQDFLPGVATLALFFLYPPAIRVFAPSAMFVTLGDAAMTIDRPFPAPYQHHFGSLVLLVLSVCAWLDPRLDMSDQKYQ
ncbi:unnamed protein product [Durusdinium trenchii]|uniref:Uncharacterized protein n=1 Tax=Durusdinium trenchii TaxID=1381693 RepID=A0ABP0JHI8_9DINO